MIQLKEAILHFEKSLVIINRQVERNKRKKALAERVFNGGTVGREIAKAD